MDVAGFKFSFRTFSSNYKELAAWSTIFAMFAVLAFSDMHVLVKLGMFATLYALYLFPYVFFDKESFSGKPNFEPKA